MNMLIETNNEGDEEKLKENGHKNCSVNSEE